MKQRKRRAGSPLKRPPDLEADEQRLSPRASEALLIERVAEFPDGRLLCTSLGRGQFAVAAAAARPAASVCCSFLDLYALEQAERQSVDGPANLRFVCEADFSQDAIDGFAMPITAGGEAELVRDLLQAAHCRLRIGGTVHFATDNPHDTWLHDELRKLFPKVTRRPEKRGVWYAATKTEPLKKLKHFECEFAFRDEERLIHAVSRPGVFGHRRIDGGARALLRTAVVRPGDRVLDLGCGSGTVSLALSLRAPDGQVDAVDANARAVQCARRGAEQNGVSNLRVHLAAVESVEFAALVPGPYDLVVANPPYYSNYRIAAIFARCAAGVLKADGTALFVAKRDEWYRENLPEFFGSVAVEAVGEYFVVRAASPISHSNSCQ